MPQTIGERILDILDEVLWEDEGQQRFEAMYLGGAEPISMGPFANCHWCLDRPSAECPACG